jgi:hypothetical protein
MADRDRWRQDELDRNRDRDRHRGSRYDRGDETNRGMFGYEGEGYFRGGGRDMEEWRDDFRDREYGYGSAGREFSAPDYNAGGEWGGGYRERGRWNDRDEIAGFRGTGYLGGDYGLPRTDRGELLESRPSYRGRGPKNYQRSDDRIREDVCERLERDDRVDASDLEVNVSAGVVTLSGNVNDREMKRRAEDIVDSCPGVRDVQNQIRVTRNRNEG